VNPVSVRVRVMVSASLSSAAVESPVLIESQIVFSNWIVSFVSKVIFSV